MEPEARSTGGNTGNCAQLASSHDTGHKALMPGVTPTQAAHIERLWSTLRTKLKFAAQAEFGGIGRKAAKDARHETSVEIYGSIGYTYMPLVQVQLLS